MKSGTALLAVLFALASFSLLAQQPQQPSPSNRPNNPATQQNPADTEPAPQNGPAASPETSTVVLSPVNGELMNKLDSKTAKTGDDVVVRTKASVKTADGTEIPKGAKLVGHVIAAQPSGAGENSQMALQFDHVELNGGQNLAVHSQIQSIAPAAGGSSNPSANGANGGDTASNAPQGTSSDRGAATAGNGYPAAGTVVAKNGEINIQTTSIPGVLLANNAPGQQDPRMAAVSSILLGAKRDIQLDGGTQMVIGVSATNGGRSNQH